MNRSEDIADRVVTGHAKDDHISEFQSLGIQNPADLKAYLTDKLSDPNIECFTSCPTHHAWREADVYYDAKDNVLIVDPADRLCEPTAFRPLDGRAAFESRIADSENRGNDRPEVLHGIEALDDKKQQLNAEYFSHAVEDPSAYPPKSQEMSDLITDRLSTEQIETNLRISSGGPAELTGSARESLMQDRADFYISNQQQMTKGM